MAPSKPYQPLLLRLLHGANASIALLAVLTSFLVYIIYDHRLFNLGIPEIPRIIGIHGTFGKLLLLGIMPAFALYSFHLGEKRLIQSDTFDKLKEVGKPIWWYSLHRVANTLMLLAITFALITGSRIEDEWLYKKEFDQIWYNLHLISWVILVGCLAFHLLMIARVGGVPLMLSLFDIKYRASDSPATWLQKIRAFFNRSSDS
ncbi:MAG: hypothetical protein RLZZ338_1724 [Cyanobacteriota bacterium]|jgi:hypothetical protein